MINGRNYIKHIQPSKSRDMPHPAGTLFCRLCLKHVPSSEHTRGKQQHFYCKRCAKEQEARVQAHTKRVQQEMKRLGVCGL